ncbi:erythromycin esterase family protein [Chitinophaga varians]|uniref:erythromycin esterase family protein n=1 Tax=Chitinophaga varians TaxID=2202339 RepID=UPI00165EE5D8|nr:erythromycin esterase family protein [Chitinophaga varians]MBC9912906.1 erythromycin esterase family protein [Chitinophaga varians]
MKKVLLLLLQFIPVVLFAQQRYNLDMEQTDSLSALPVGWSTFAVRPNVNHTLLDSTTVYAGKYAILLTKDSIGETTPSIVMYAIPAGFDGKTLKLRGHIRTEAVEGGYAGLWMRVDGTSAFDNMSNRGIKGTTPWTPYEIELKLEKSATNVMLGGLLTGKGKMWMDSLSLSVDGKDIQLIPEEDVAAKTDRQRWLKAHAMPLKAVDAGHGSKDLQGLKLLVGNARIVALGECTHGSSEVFRMKHRLLEFLVTEMGFRIFAIEANLPETNIMNDYVLHGKGSAEKGLDAMYFWTWNTKEVLEMAKWMRTYNIAHPDKMVQFVGFDMQFTRGACDNLSQFATQYAPELKPVMDSVVLYCNRYKRVTFDHPIPGEDKERLAGWLNEIGDLLKNNRKQYAQLAGDSVWAWQTRYLVVLQQYLKMYGEFRYGRLIRDESMAENVAWIAAQYPDQKLVLWAHDGHVGRRAASMGGHLDKTFKKKMVVVGFGTANGQYTAVKKGKGLQRDNTLCAPISRSFERYAQATGIGNFILDIRKESLQDERASWLLNSARLRSIGALTPDNCNTQFEGGVLSDIYDAIIYIENTTASEIRYGN